MGAKKPGIGVSTAPEIFSGFYRADLFFARLFMRGQIGGDFFLRAAGLHAVCEVLDIPRSLRGVIFLLDDQPGIPVAALAAILHVDDRPGAAQFLAMQMELKIAARDLGRARFFADQIECPAIPQHHAARRRSCLWGCCLRNRRNRADGPRPWQRGASRKGRATGLWEPPTISACRRFRGGSRSAAASRYASG